MDFGALVKRQCQQMDKGSMVAIRLSGEDEHVRKSSTVATLATDIDNNKTGLIAAEEWSILEGILLTTLFRSLTSK